MCYIMDVRFNGYSSKMAAYKYGLMFTLSILLITEVACVTPYPKQNSAIVYTCPSEFTKLGSSCYYFSKTQASWEEAYYFCKDKGSNLTAPERWEDRNIREYLNQDGIERGDRWMGGLYDWEAKAWKWGGELRTMKYQSFSRMPRLPPEKLKWHCVAMIPELLYRWSPRVCIQKKFFICQSKLKRVQQNQIEGWNVNNNEIPLESDVDNEVNPNMSPGNNYMNDRNNYNNQVGDNNNIPNGRTIGRTAYGYRRTGNETRIKRKKKPFPGYKRIKGDPEATYIHNVNALKSGKSGLSDAQIEKHLHRLERLRRREEREKRRKENLRNQRNRQRSRSQKKQDEDSILASETSNIRSRHIISSKDGDPPVKVIQDNEVKGFLSFANVTQRTYTMNNKLSPLHPNTIIEIHEIVDKKKQ